jgi:hypothetical protein
MRRRLSTPIRVYTVPASCCAADSGKLGETGDNPRVSEKFNLSHSERQRNRRKWSLSRISRISRDFPDFPDFPHQEEANLYSCTSEPNFFSAILNASVSHFSTD